MKQLAKAVTDQIVLRNEQANLNAKKIAAMLGKFLRFAPKGRIDELIGFLNFCANGAAPPEILTKLKKDNIVVKVDGFSELVREGKDYQQFTSLKKESKHLHERLVNKQGTWSALRCQAPVLNQKETADYLSRIQEIAKNQPNFKEVSPETKANEGDLVILDYDATVNGNSFKGGEGKNVQLTIGKDLFLKGFDK